MAIVVEDGTGLADANSYVSIAYADSYFYDRGNSVWDTYTPENKAQALILATEYLDMYYNYTGYKSSSTQALDWPRDYAYDVDSNEITDIPVTLKKMTCEAAVRAIASELQPDLESGRTIQREKIANAVEVEYAEGSGGSSEPIYLVIDRLGFSTGIVISKNRTSGQLRVTRV